MVGRDEWRVRLRPSRAEHAAPWGRAPARSGRERFKDLGVLSSRGALPRDRRFTSKKDDQHLPGKRRSRIAESEKPYTEPRPGEIAAMNDSEFDTAPKTPPCILIISRAAR